MTSQTSLHDNTHQHDDAHQQAATEININSLRYQAGASAPSHEQSDTPSVLRNISLQFNPGECVLLCGTSGGGKSSLLRLLNGLIPHYHPATIEGSARISYTTDSRSSVINPAQEPLWVTGDAVATVFQNPRTQFFTTDVTSELAFALENRADDPSAIRARIADVASRSHIDYLLGRSLFQISGGERQLVACASAVVQNPALYLFDEPTSNLSPAAIERFADFVRSIKAAGASIIIAEHRLYFLRDIIDRAIIVDHTVHADMPAAAFFSMSDSDRAQFGLRQLNKPDIEVPIKRIHTKTHEPESPHLSRADMEVGLTLNNLNVRYGRHVIWDIPRLHFSRGKVTALTGANGVGKTTLANTICGLKKPKRATISLDGQTVTPKDLLRRTYMVMQDVHRQLFSESVRKEISLGLSGISPSDVEELLERFDLADMAERHPLSLSGGQKQHLVVAAATAMKRDVYVFDEPSSGLDRAHLDAVAHTLRELAQNDKVVILITHDYELINACADIDYHLE